MGVKGLKKFLRDKGLVKIVSVDTFANTKIAVDISSYIYKNKAIFGDDWKNPMLNLLMGLRKYDIHGNFIPDGKAPPEKKKEQDRRRETKKDLDDSLFNLEIDFDRYIKTKETTPLLVETMKKILSKAHQEAKVVKLMHRGLNKPADGINVKLMTEYIEKKKNQIINISKKDMEDLEELMKVFGVPWIQAPGEAEALGSYLCAIEECRAILTEDTDVLAYGAGVFLSDFNVAKGTFEAIYLSEVLETLELTQDQFLDLCIMSEVDYNENVPGIGIGRAYTAIKKHETIEQWESSTGVDISILNHLDCRRIFKTFQGLTSDELKNKYKTKYWDVDPDFAIVKKFLITRNIRYGDIEKNWRPTDLIFIDEIPELENTNSVNLFVEHMKPYMPAYTETSSKYASLLNTLENIKLDDVNSVNSSYSVSFKELMNRFINRIKWQNFTDISSHKFQKETDKRLRIIAEDFNRPGAIPESNQLDILNKTLFQIKCDENNKSKNETRENTEKEETKEDEIEFEIELVD